MNDEELNDAATETDAAADTEADSAAEPEEAPVIEAPPTPPAPRDPRVAVGLDRSRNGEYDYIDLPLRPHEGRDRGIVVDGASYEHCADDADGCWLYRHAHQ